MSAPLKPSSPRRPNARPAHRAAASALDSRGRLLASAAAEFAARGFAGATVDRIAARARLNKAMIYYHFRSKQALYRELLRAMFTEVGDLMRAIGGSSATPYDKLDAFVATLVHAGMDRPNLPPIILREIAEGGRHLDPATLRPLIGVVQVMAAIVAEGQARRQFRQVDPLLIHLTTIWPVMVYLTSAPMRQMVATVGHVDTSGLTPDGFIRHMQDLNRRAVALDPSGPRSLSGRGEPCPP